MEHHHTEYSLNIITKGYNHTSSILKSISNIEFPHLTIFNSERNNISSIEIFSRVRMPSLKFISLGYSSFMLDHNSLTKIRTLTKCYFPHLENL